MLHNLLVIRLSTRVPETAFNKVRSLPCFVSAIPRTFHSKDNIEFDVYIEVPGPTTIELTDEGLAILRALSW